MALMHFKLRGGLRRSFAERGPTHPVTVRGSLVLRESLDVGWTRPVVLLVGLTKYDLPDRLRVSSVHGAT
jgi:hypothetical protein